MSRHQFEKALEKLRRAPAKEKVLLLILSGHTDAEIALETGTKKGTVRKQISNLYEDFDIKGDFEGDRRSRREPLLEKVGRYKPDLLSDKLNNFSSKTELNDVKNPVEIESPTEHLSSKQGVDYTLLDIVAQMTGRIESSYLPNKSLQALVTQMRGEIENPWQPNKQVQAIVAETKRKIGNSWLGR
jgi:transcription initiation factor IIE alpha subunit